MIIREIAGIPAYRPRFDAIEQALASEKPMVAWGFFAAEPLLEEIGFAAGVYDQSPRNKNYPPWRTREMTIDEVRSEWRRILDLPVDLDAFMNVIEAVNWEDAEMDARIRGIIR